MRLSATQQVTDTLKKRELILEYIENPQYPEYLKFEAIQDRCALLDSVKVGDDVEVFFNLKGRPWTDKTAKKHILTRCSYGVLMYWAPLAAAVRLNMRRRLISAQRLTTTTCRFNKALFNLTILKTIRSTRYAGVFSY